MTTAGVTNTPKASEPAGNGSALDAELLTVSDVAVRFGGVAALSKVSFTVRSGEVVAVVGPNGAGKSTLLNCLSGLLRGQARGSAAISGTSVLDKSPAQIAALGVGRSFQSPPLIEEETVLENVLAGAHRRLAYGLFTQTFRPRRVAALEAEQAGPARAVLQYVGLDDRAHVQVGGLPYGARKLVDIARSMLCGDKFLLLDEPTSGLDIGEQRHVKQLLNRIRDERRLTVLVVEHHMDLVRECADHVIGLQAGSVLATGTAAEVLDSDAFRAAIVGTSQAGSDEQSEEESA
jgi:branched-chain amino acid transport system ATP-binding protein